MQAMKSRPSPAPARRSTLLALTTLVALVLGACGARERPGTPPKHVLLITVDTLRADHMSAYLYGRPTTFTGATDEDKLAGRDLSLDRLAEEGVLFRHAFAPRGMTAPSVASLLTGLTPLEHGLLTNTQRLDSSLPTLAERFASAGFDTAGFSANRLIAKGSGLTEGFAHFETYTEGDKDLEVVRGAMDWLGERDLDDGPPVFLWLHLVGPHLPYEPLPIGGEDFAARFTDPGYAGPADGSRAFLDQAYLERRPLDGQDVHHVVSLYDGEVARVNFLLQRFLEVYSGVYEDPPKRRLDDTLLVFAADHGEELYERNHYWAHSKSVYSSVLHVPLFLRHPPSLTGRRVVDEHVTLEDVGPTLLEWFDLPELPGAYGRSLLPLVDTYDTFTFEARPAFGGYENSIFTVRAPKANGDGDWRLVWNPDEVEPDDRPLGAYPIPKLALFDVALDPKEQRDVKDAHPDVTEELLEKLVTWRAERLPRAGTVEDPGQRAAAEDMGYVGTSGKPPGGPGSEPAQTEDELGEGE